MPWHNFSFAKKTSREFDKNIEIITDVKFLIVSKAIVLKDAVY